MQANKFDVARLKYKPSPIRCLLIAEAPPQETSDRFFYFEQVNRGDTLFLETMKTLYPSFCLNNYGDADTYKIRSSKQILLERFKKDGFYLEDSSSTPLPKDLSSSQKKKYIKNELPQLLLKLPALINKSTPIILIASTVFEVCNDVLRANGYKVLNKKVIPFPLGFQNEFKAGLRELLVTNKLFPGN